MTRRRKKKVGLQKEVSSVFDGVLIPDRKSDRKTGHEHASDGSKAVSSKQTAADSLVPKSSLMKKVPGSKTSSGAIAADHPVHTILSERKATKSPARKATPQPQLDHGEDKTTPDHADVPSTPTDLQRVVPPSLSTKKPLLAKNLLGGIALGRRKSVPPKLTAPDDSVLECIPEQESPPIKNLPEKADTDRIAEVLPKLTTPDQSSPQRPPKPEPQKTDKPSDEAAQNQKPGILSWLMSPGDPDAKDMPPEQPRQKDEPSHKSPSDRADDDHKIILDRLIPKPSSPQKRQKAQSSSGGVAPGKKRVPPKLTAPDRPMTSPGPSKEKSKQANDTQGKAKVPHKADQKPSNLKRSAPEPRTSQSSLISKLSQSETASDKRDTDRPAEVPPTPRSAESQTSRGPVSEKRHKPTPPSPQPVAASHREAPTPTEPKRPTLRRRISEKLRTPKPGAGSAKQRAMMLLIPILSIVLIFLFRQVLSKSPNRTSGANTTETPVAVKTDSDRAIEWKIPEPLPAVMRDPTKLSVQDEPPAQSDNPEPQVEPTKSKLIEVGAIVFSQDKPSAVVNGHIVHAGEVISGVTVLRIYRDSVEFEKNGKTWFQKVHE